MTIYLAFHQECQKLSPINHAFIKRITSISSASAAANFEVTYHAHPKFAAEITVSIYYNSAPSDANSIACGDLFVDVVVTHDAIQDNEARHTISRAVSYVAAYQDAIVTANVAKELVQSQVQFHGLLEVVRHHAQGLPKNEHVKYTDGHP